MPIIVQVQQRNGTPIFKVTGVGVWGVDFSAVFGATKLLGDTVSWYYPAYYPVYKIVVEDLQVTGKHHQVDVDFSDAATAHIDEMDKIPGYIAAEKLPDHFEFRTKPYQHQMDGLLHLLYSLRAALFYDCGTGKTKIVIDWQRATRCWPIIICPRIAMHVWPAELKIHGIDQEYQPIDGATKAKKLRQIEEAGQYHGMVVTYDTLRIYYELIAKVVPFNALVADESQKIKQSASQRTKVALALSRGAYRRVIMSGTPSLGDPRDVYPQYRFLAPYFMPWNIFKFKNMFCVTSPYNKHIVTAFKNLDMLNRRVRLVSIRRKKEDCLDLPERTFQDITVGHRPKQKKLYNELVHAHTQAGGQDLATIVNAMVSGGSRLDVAHAAILINKLVQISCGFVLTQPPLENDPCLGCDEVRTCVEAEPPVKPWSSRCTRTDLGQPPKSIPERLDSAKAETLADLLDELLEEPTNKVIIWGQYIEELTIIEEVVVQKNIGYVRVDGRNTQHAATFQDRFNKDPECRVWLGQVATGVAITLNSAQYMVYYSLPWNMEHYAQSLDRNHRVGQSKNVTVYRLLAEGVDQHIAEALTVKWKVAESIVADKDVTTSKVARPITKVREV